MKKPILIIEDDMDIRQSMSDIFEDLGYKVYTAANGQEGLNVLRKTEHPPGLIILDLMMPIMDGEGFRAEQVKDEALIKIPTVLLSADSRLPIRAKDIGFQEYVKKPIDLDHLISLAQKYCD